MVWGVVLWVVGSGGRHFAHCVRVGHPDVVDLRIEPAPALHGRAIARIQGVLKVPEPQCPKGAVGVGQEQEGSFCGAHFNRVSCGGPFCFVPF